ncbi:30S ribosomal protein S13 [Candidatus Aerophobetes bacterium]|jgi:small subunit ribosomal protein S13|uniref:Small ribosomal subunit protein uS13 n=1 Tax=Aerophobetes bacterium TaxID=2030807 RepID=A0A523Y3M8_UNCAE|nr:MAG: 30S ribosomal protein S13 [Candidatus Aerophobetes bacterium]TEU03672.1 MAG: 30S ribosomal protein S13 [Candidatus Aerophobetes bacterium]TKJ47774.1 MAG: 30S ribosomal protein S13 [Candidatus Aerophobetes bacterium Ae_b3a]
MARIAGVEIPPNKKIRIGLTSIYGIGYSLTKEIISKTGVNPDTQGKNLTEDEVNKLRRIIENDYKIEGELRRQVSSDVSRLIHIGCYRGIRHKKGLPVRGQRTRSNARSRKGPRRTLGKKKKGTK